MKGCKGYRVAVVLMAMLSAVISNANELPDGPAASAVVKPAPVESEAKSTMGVKGLSLETTLTLEYISNVSGGISRDSAFLGNIDIIGGLDTEAAGWWSGGTFSVYGLGNFNNGRVPTEIIGDIQASSNIEAPETFKLYEAWYNHSFMDNSLLVLVGLHDYNSEFDVMEYGGVFHNSSFGIAPGISQAGPSIFPTAALGLRVAVKPTEGAYILSGIYDGVAGDPCDDESSDIQFDSGDGVFYALETGLTRAEGSDAPYYKVALGGWYHTKRCEDLAGQPVENNGGGYVIVERQIYQEQDKAQGLGIFGQVGSAPDDINVIAYSVIGGLNYTGLIPGRDEDVTALGFSQAILSDDYLALEENAGLNDSETAIELVYQAGLTEWFTIKPDIQYIINPASAPGIDNALQIGVRAELVF